MAYQPAADERLLLGPRSGSSRDDRIYVQDLSALLNVGGGRITVIARKMGLLHRARTRPRAMSVHWVTPYGARRLITYFRAIQGALAFDGVDHGALTEVMRTRAAVQRARRKRIQSGVLNKP